MASDECTPSTNKMTLRAAKSVHTDRPSTLEAATPTALASSMTTHLRGAESKESSPPSVIPQSSGHNVATSGNEHSGPQATQQATSNLPRNPTGIAGIGVAQAIQTPKPQENRRLLGIPSYQGQSYADRSYDYLSKYPPDAEGRELEPDARVWKVYLDESESYDNDMIKGFRDTIDSLLVFAALFSSIVSGFIGQTSQALEPDYAKIGVSLMFEQIQVLRAAGNATRIEEIPRSPLTPDSVTHSTLDVFINWLFFASLAFSLATAFIAVLMKEWLQAFTALVPGDAKRRSLTRQFRFTGLQKWKLPEIINVLPLFLHLALALFLIGLCLFVSEFHPSITVMVGVVTCAAIAFYVITGALPAVHLDCPYRLPILFIPAGLVVYAVNWIRFNVSKRLWKNPSIYRPFLSLSPLHSQEQDQVSRWIFSEKLEGLALGWLFTETPSASVQRVALHGVSRFLQRGTFRSVEQDGTPSLSEGAISLRDSLPLQSMSLSALQFGTPESRIEDGPLLRDLVLSIRRICGRPVLSRSAADQVVRTPYSMTFIRANVIEEKGMDWVDHYAMIWKALELDKWDVVMHLLNSSPHSLWKVAVNGCRALAFASASPVISHADWVAIFSIVKENGVDFNTYYFVEPTWSTVLHLVASYGTLAALQHLISHVPNLFLNVADRLGSTPLHLACDRGKDYTELVIQTLLSVGADPNIVDNKGCLPLHNACSNAFRDFGCTEAGLKVIEELVKAIGNINRRSKDGFTPLDLLEKSDQKDSEEGKAGYLLMRQHGALLAKELAQGEEDEAMKGVEEVPEHIEVRGDIEDKTAGQGQAVKEDTDEEKEALLFLRRSE